MSRQYSNRSYLPFYHSMSSDYTPRRFRPSAQNNFSQFQYSPSPQRQALLLNHNNNHPHSTVILHLFYLVFIKNFFFEGGIVNFLSSIQL